MIKSSLEPSNQKFIFIIPKSHRHLHLFDDLEEESNVELIFVNQKSVIKPLELLRKIHTSYTVNKFIKLPFHNLWYEKVNLEALSENDYVVVLDGALTILNAKKTNKLVKTNKFSLVLLLINSLNAESVSMVEVKDKIKKFHWNDIYSFDPQDCKENNFKQLGLSYYSKKEILNENKISTDIFFVGGLKGNRENDILNTFEFLNSNGCSTNFQLMISGVRKFKQQKYEDVIEYIRGKWIPYNQILKQVVSSNCILEIVQKGQTGPSLRYFEAVCYNKKLLTNNKYTKNFPFYNSKYMKIFDDISDIDVDWVKKEEKIDYHYDEDFSPKQLLNKLIN
ncbi:hypothetical protein [Enterococcus avium]|uniref:hypothetical protein n=1 Tax=Enterococcus avium TaxID=33945 RepID=UPI002890CB6D|nr:hypothetical protein [Enterococcus avium]MDT2565987.1 hypothetical protein [Enterococcus avium]